MVERFSSKIIFEVGFQKKILNEIISNEKLSQRKFAKILRVSRRGLRNWLNEERLMPKSIFEIILEKFPFTKVYKKYVLEELPKNWPQIKGGKIRSKMKNNLTTKDRIRGFKKAKIMSSKRKIIGPKGELMFNKEERLVAEELLKNNLEYKYEPIILVGKNYAVPDFVVGNVIIERCGYGNWNPYWSNLLKKLRRFEKYKKGKVIILTPSKYFVIAVKKLNKLKNITVIKEENIELLSDFIGPRAHNN